MTPTPARRRSPLDVFRYLDYRKFLKELYEAQKTRGLSYRGFAKRAGLGAPNYLKLVIEGERNLTPSMAQRFAAACSLSDEAGRYFCELVAFNQAESAPEKAACHQRLLSFARYRDAHRLDASHADYYGSWYVPAIRELVTCADFREEPRWIARKLRPAIKTSEARQALHTLLKLGLIARDQYGKLVQTSAIVTTGEETQGTHIATYHTEMMRRATASIDLVPSPERDISSLTVCVSAEGLPKLKARLQEMRRELLALCEQEQPRSQVVQINFQLFPLTHATMDEQRAPKSGILRTEHDDEQDAE